MGRVSFRNDFYLHRKADRAGIPALGLLVCMVAFSDRHGTEGFMPVDRLHELGRLPGELELITHETLADALLTARLLHAVDGGYLVHDYAHYQRTRAQREQEREQARERMRRVRSRSGEPGRTPPYVQPPSEGSSLCEDFSLSVVQSEAEHFTTTNPLNLLASRVAGADHRSVSAWRSAAAGLPLEWACARAFEALQRVRQLDQVRNEAAFITAQLKRLQDEAVR